MKKRSVPGIVFAIFVFVAFSLRTMAQEPASQPSLQTPLFTFVVVSDLHTSEKTGPEYLRAFIKQIETLSDKPDFVLVTGDIHVEPFKKVLEATRPAIPFHVALGNHETRPFRDMLAKMFPADFKDTDFYSYTHKNSSFIVLSDAAANGDHVGHFDSEAIKGSSQGKWLEDQLAQYRKSADHIFIFAHIPPHPQGLVEGNMFLSTNDQKQLKELTLKYKPSALFFGHLHKAMEFNMGDSPVYILPSLNWNFEQQQPRSFMLVKVFKDRIAAQAVSLKLDPSIK
jgi:Icc-related predicted phosphoesterase